MASLSNLLGRTNALTSSFDEQNLEKGRIFMYTTGSQSANFCSNIHWRAPGRGTAVVEIWGAAGSGGKMCCCGAGLPGNPGAYAKKTVKVDADTWFCFDTGMSCGNASALCMRGCSEGTCLYMCSPNGLLSGGDGFCLCMCAEGGMGGANYCNCSGAAYAPICRFIGCNYCVTNTNSCGVACNYGSTYNWLPTAYGGDVNWSPSEPDTCRFSKLEINHCNMCCYDCYKATIVVPPGIWGPEEQRIEHFYACTDWRQMRNEGFYHYFQQINAMARSPIMSAPMMMCNNSIQYCGCYEYQGCHPVVSMAIPGYGGMTCTSVRDHAGRGGHGGVKIRFIQD